MPSDDGEPMTPPFVQVAAKPEGNMCQIFHPSSVSGGHWWYQTKSSLRGRRSKVKVFVCR